MLLDGPTDGSSKEITQGTPNWIGKIGMKCHRMKLTMKK